MPTILDTASESSRALPPEQATTQCTAAEPPILLRTRQQARDCLAKHLIPVGYGPKGQPLYAKKDIDSLNIILPEDI